MQPLIETPEPLPETGVLANHSSDFMLPKRDSHTVGLTDPIMEVAPRPKNGHTNKQTNKQTQ